MTSKARVCAGLLVALGFTHCRQDMHDQPRTKPFRSNPEFADGTSSRLPPSGTVARGEITDDDLLVYGVENGELATAYPFVVTDAVMKRGQERFHIYCEPCHGLLGQGDGPVARRGFFPRPVADLQQDRYRYLPEGYIFGVITNGFNTMAPYANALIPEDRWAIVAYLRALQLSQHASSEDVSPEELEKRGGKAPWR